MEENNKRSSFSFADGINIESLKKTEEKNKVSKIERIANLRESLDLYTKLIPNRPDQVEYFKAMGELRTLSPAVFKQACSFYIPTREYSYKVFGELIEQKDSGLINDNGNPTYMGRYVYTIKGFNDEVIGFIGYDNTSDIKYLVSRTLGFGTSNSFFGMHMMRWIYSKGYVIVFEGIVDCLWLWSLGIPAISLNGSRLTAFVATILKRFGFYVLLVPDNDETGDLVINYWRKDLPEASVLQTVNEKDMDEWRRVFEKEGRKEHLQTLNKALQLFYESASSSLTIDLRIDDLEVIVL